MQWALKGFPESQVDAENRRLNRVKQTLKARKIELQAQLKASQDAVINVPNLERFVKEIQDKLPNLDYEGQCLALDMLGITVWLDGENIEITGTIDPGIVLTPSLAGYSPCGVVGQNYGISYGCCEGGRVGKDNTEGVRGRESEINQNRTGPLFLIIDNSIIKHYTKVLKQALTSKFSTNFALEEHNDYI